MKFLGGSQSGVTFVNMINKVRNMSGKIEGQCHSCARTSGSVLYGLPLHQKGDVNKATW